VTSVDAHRTATVRRATSESTVEVRVDLDGAGTGDVSTGVPFYDHMLLSLAKHSLIDLRVRADGDTEVDAHHTVEDVAIVLGQAVREALGDKRGIAFSAGGLFRPASFTGPEARSFCLLCACVKTDVLTIRQSGGAGWPAINTGGSNRVKKHIVSL